MNLCCRNLASDATNCGACGNACDRGELCDAGECVPADQGCSAGLSECRGQNDTMACVDTDNDVFNCGDCGERCGSDEVCADGNCVQYARVSECNQCPCDACDQRLDNGVCCDLFDVPMCVEDGPCPG